MNRLSVGLVALLSLGSVPLRAGAETPAVSTARQQPSPPGSGGTAPQVDPQRETKDVFAIRTALVSVSHHRGELIQGLEPRDFEVYERDIERDVVDAVADPTGKEIYLLVDTSMSFRGEVPALRHGLAEFLAAIRAPNRLTIYEFGGSVRRLAGPTSDRFELARALDGILARPQGAYLMEAVSQITAEMEFAGAKEERPFAVVVVTAAGHKVTPDYADVMKRAWQTEATYHVVTFEPRNRQSALGDQALIDDALAEFAAQTGGTSTPVFAASGLGKALGRLSTVLFQPLYRVSFLTEVDPPTRLEDLSIAIVGGGASVRVLELASRELHVEASPP